VVMKFKKGDTVKLNGQYKLVFPWRPRRNVAKVKEVTRFGLIWVHVRFLSGEAFTSEEKYWKKAY
jgi:hypothetical protein